MFENIGTFKDFTDGSIKKVFQDEALNVIEMTLLNKKGDKDVVCVPSHYFCNLGCKMCHLTNEKLNKPMIPIKYEDFMLCLIETLSRNENNQLIKRTNKKKLLISFMGVGDALLNLNLIKKVYLHEDILKKRFKYEEISYALATMMPNDNILLLTKMVNKLNIPLKIHFSLHTPFNEKRKKLIPASNIEINMALKYLKDYEKVITSNAVIKRKYELFHKDFIPIEIHYTLIKDVNDTFEELDELLNLLKTYPIPLKFLKFNPKEDLLISLKEEMWVKTIKEKIPNLKVKRYAPPGKEIGSSCGEFTKHYYYREIESLEEKEKFKLWQQKHQVEI